MSRVLRACISLAHAATLAVLTPAAGADLAQAEQRKLANGLEVVVIPDHRAPVVTHVVAYRSGAAADPPGESGLAHLVEHLMYKSTATMPAGAFARTISRLGGRENAVTSHDATIYHQRVPKQALARVMALEADRMVNMRFDDEEVRRELDVVMEERRQRIDLSPLDQLNEQITAALHAGTPYAHPVLGWPDEIGRLTRAEAMTFYERNYRPDNAIVVVQGDVDAPEVFGLADETYGAVPSRRLSDDAPVNGGPVPRRERVERVDARVPSTSLVRMAFVPRINAERAVRAESLEVLMRILAQGETSRLHARLVRKDGLAIATDGGISETRDGNRLALYAVAAPGASIPRIETAIAEEIRAIAEAGVSEDELSRALTVIATKDTYDGDKQLTSALRVAAASAIGRTLDDMRRRARRLGLVSCDDLREAANAALRSDRLVTGILRPAGETRPEAGEARQ